MSLYEFFLAMHILAAAVWIGADALLQVLALHVRRERDPVRTARFARDVEALGLRVQTPAAVLLLVFGLLLVWEGPWGWGDLWISLGLVAYALLFVAGAGFFGPESGRIGKLIDAAGGTTTPEAERRIGRLLLLTRIELVLLVAVVFDMVAKPTT